MEPLFSDHRKTQTNVDLTEGWPLIWNSFTWKYEGEGFRKRGLKRGVVSHQDGLLSG